MRCINVESLECFWLYIDGLDPSPLVRYGIAAPNYTVIAISFNYFLPDPCNSSDTKSVIQNVRERKTEEERDHRGRTMRYRRIANREIAVCK